MSVNKSKIARAARKAHKRKAETSRAQFMALVVIGAVTPEVFKELDADAKLTTSHKHRAAVYQYHIRNAAP